MKLCKDCRWAHCTLASCEDKPFYWECHHDRARTTTPPDPVLGHPIREAWMSCREARAMRALTGRPLCGPDGKFWEPIGFGEALGPRGGGDA